jgi:hypothetical protein
MIGGYGKGYFSLHGWPHNLRTGVPPVSRFTFYRLDMYSAFFIYLFLILREPLNSVVCILVMQRLGVITCLSNKSGHYRKK